VVWSSLLAKISCSTRCENEVKTSLSAELSGSLTGYEDKLRASSSVEVSDSLGTYVSVLFDGRL